MSTSEVSTEIDLDAMPMPQSEIDGTFSQVGAILDNGHFVYASRKHGKAYVNKDGAYVFPTATNRLCREMARRMRGQGIEVVLAPATGGVILSGVVASHLSRFSKTAVPSLFAERDIADGELEFKRGYDKELRPGKRVVAVVGELGDGVGARSLIAAIRRTGAIVIGLGALTNKWGLGTANLDVPQVFASRAPGVDEFDAADQMLAYPYSLGPRCRSIAERFFENSIQTVVGQAPEGSLLAQLVARNLTEFGQGGDEVTSIYAERPTSGNFSLRRGFDKLIVGKKVGICEDILTTGKSAKEIVDLARAMGGTVIRVDVLCNRGGVTSETLGAPELTALKNVMFEAWDAPCPLCLSDPPIPVNTQYGKGAAYLRERETAAAGK